jgi:hypothetical protein
MGKFVITLEEPDDYSSRSNIGVLRTVDDISELVQKRSFWFRKPPFHLVELPEQQLLLKGLPQGFQIFVL